MTVYFATNRHKKTVCLVPASSFDELRCRAVFGIGMPDNSIANGIGRCPASEFEARAAKSGYKILGSPIPVSLSAESDFIEA